MPKVASKGEGKRAKKDANAPKRNLSAYFIFCAEERPRVKASDPNLSLGDTAKELGRRWAAVDAATKSKFEKLAAKDKERYEREKAAYKGGATGKAAGASAAVSKGPAKGAAKKPAAKGKAPVHEDSEEEDEESEDDE
jgi:high mobility group protein B2